MYCRPFVCQACGFTQDAMIDDCLLNLIADPSLGPAAGGNLFVCTRFEDKESIQNFLVKCFPDRSSYPSNGRSLMI